MEFSELVRTVPYGHARSAHVSYHRVVGSYYVGRQSRTKKIYCCGNRVSGWGADQFPVGVTNNFRLEGRTFSGWSDKHYPGEAMDSLRV